MKKNQPAVSIVVPIYNVEKYLTDCIDSLLNQNIPLEVILVDDGSTDSSGSIADSYQKNDDRIKVIHQNNQGLSVSRNTGLKYAEGEYVVFIDSDDWIEENSLNVLYKQARNADADMIMAGIQFYYPNGSNFEPFAKILKQYENRIFTGEKWFTLLFSSGIYYLMVCNYMYKREWLAAENMFFENIIHEDELWTPKALSKAKKIVISNNVFYNYRQREGSIMHSLVNTNRLKSLLYIANKLAEYSKNYTFKGNQEFKSWLWVDIMRLYSIPFGLTASIRDSSFVLPKHYLYVLPKIFHKLDKDSKVITKYFYLSAKQGLTKYHLWRNHTSISKVWNMESQDLILLYNNPEWNIIEYEEIPNNYFVTTDRKYLQDAHIVIFHMPDLAQHLDEDLEKSDNQIWIAWYMESEENYPFLKDKDFMDVFDLTMSYKQNADIIYPYYKYEDININNQDINMDKKDKICMLISSQFNKSGRIQYLQELKQYTDIDSYGKLFNNKIMINDNGIKSKMELYSSYKFVIAFENSICEDYVTEKFFDPLRAGTVPIYLGAPNIDDFSPGDNCFVDVRDFQNPKNLADFINTCYKSDSLYHKFYDWKNKPLRTTFVKKVSMLEKNIFTSLCEKINHILNSRIKNQNN